ncbi:3-ketoacyl-ACP reductase [Anaerocolumna cellulosilytica]|uniref:3-ketoacyl-ACP reductase n=1 Tax=Anaerocolumna cellulosilytica TaxID=433286 RepID=A0A6S6QND9_9FIRM|nr:3-oxoacyl-ACP reductase FabG [Anaerocolumna cellulosilytica]MBB5195791.1 3-oxoacyl-[acyl-carrier protein] reductase [Anaerocolumna cellulosilytica]BCJ92873.1 3-ketoacyl-ACP reductase [Anaerocolumna cellulosilytica]
MSAKTVLITGASRGIGKAIALKFAKEGYNLVITCREQETELNKTKAELESLGVNCLTYLGDMGSYEVVQELFAAARNQFGTIDVLINNAGISHIGLFTDMNFKDWNEILNTNLTSVFNCCHLAIPGMIAVQKGKIINISSVWGITGASCEVAYSATKGGINAFTKALAKELAPSNIQVNAIACGAIDTQMNQFLEKDEMDALIESIPANRLGKTAEVAELVFQLASGNDYLNGQVIPLDGAWI